MEKVGFLTPNNKKEYMYYLELLNYCKEICMSKTYIKEFDKFQKNYSNFTPYFDFVVFRLGYIFLNPLFLRHYSLSPFKNELFMLEGDLETYEQGIDLISRQSNSNGFFPFMSMSSDNILVKDKISKNNLKDCMIDPKMNGYISKTNETPGRSHLVTVYTILNQLLQISPKINDYYYSWLLNDYNGANGFNISDIINYFIKNFGFIRFVTPKDNFGGVIEMNSSTFNNAQNKFISNYIENNDYIIADFEIFNDTLNSEYNRSLNKMKKS